MTKVLSGGCLCGAVRFEITGGTSQLDKCHCSLCRKASGSGHTTTAITYADNLRWLSGEDAIRSYEYSEIYTPHFCGTCGSPVPLVGKFGYCFIPVGSLDDDPGLKVYKHIFVASKASWDHIGDDAPQYAERPPINDAD